MLNKEGTIREVAARCDSTQREVRAVLDALRDVVYTNIATGESVKPFDGVTFKGVVSPAKTARNPMTGETVDVPERIHPRAVFGKYAKDQMGND